jgi:hypothetical protein
MRRLFVLVSVSFVLAGCPLQIERTIEDTLYFIREANKSSRNIYIQYYYKRPSNNTIFLERIHLSPGSEYNDSDSNYDHYDPGIGYGSSNDRSTPEYNSPLETINKIVIVDADSRKVLKSITEPGLVVELEKAREDYGMRCRFEYYIVSITDELFDGE